MARSTRARPAGPDRPVRHPARTRGGLDRRACSPRSPTTTLSRSCDTPGTSACATSMSPRSTATGRRSGDSAPASPAGRATSSSSPPRSAAWSGRRTTSRRAPTSTARRSAIVRTPTTPTRRDVASSSTTAPTGSDARSRRASSDSGCLASTSSSSTIPRTTGKPRSARRSRRSPGFGRKGRSVRSASGLKDSAMLARFAREADFDAFLVAGRYTLLDQDALTELLPLCEERGDRRGHRRRHEQRRAGRPSARHALRVRAGLGRGHRACPRPRGRVRAPRRASAGGRDAVPARAPGRDRA